MFQAKHRDPPSLVRRPSGPRIMGILNVTPDSFSDGGKYFSVAEAVQRGLQLIEEGADILDIGGESTRPYSVAVDAEEEIHRIIPVIRSLAAQSAIPISIDTSKAQVAREALAAGATMINDVTGLQGDPGMLELAVASDVAVCAMHMRGTPQTMQDDPQYEDVVDEVFQYLAGRRDTLLRAGIKRERIALDPGLGFGKTHEHNLALLANIDRFAALGCSVLVGHSRKGFLARLIGNKERDRTIASVGMSLALAQRRVDILRIHDVGPTRDAWLAFQAAAATSR